MKYLLDTDVIIDHLRGKTDLSDSLKSDNLSISIITYGELIFGSEKSEQKEKTKKLVLDFINDLSIKIITLDQKIMEEYGKIKAQLEKKGKGLDDFDLLIASTAKIRLLTLVTRNKKHFGRINKLQLKYTYLQ